MTDKPILFSGPMVRALLSGRKTQTRRVLKPHPDYRGGAGDYHDAEEWGWEDEDGYHVSVLDIAPNGYRVGDHLWVREAFSYDRLDVDRDGILPPWYWADGNPDTGDFSRPKPSIHMPRWASRLTLIVTDVRVQRLREITPADAIAEGISPAANSQTIDCDTPDPRDDFRTLWDSLNAKRAPWESNPWVAAITFDVRRTNIDQMEETS